MSYLERFFPVSHPRSLLSVFSVTRSIYSFFTVGPSVFGVIAKGEDVRSYVSCANTNSAPFLGSAVSDFCDYPNEEFFFKLDQSLNPEKNMLILCPLKGFMHLFSSLQLSV